MSHNFWTGSYQSKQSFSLMLEWMKWCIKKKLWTRCYQCLQFLKEVSNVHSKRVWNISFHTSRSRHFNKMEELNSEFHFRVYYCLFKKKMTRIKNNPNYYANIGDITWIYTSCNNNYDSLFKTFNLFKTYLMSFS